VIVRWLPGLASNLTASKYPEYWGRGRELNPRPTDYEAVWAACSLVSFQRTPSVPVRITLHHTWRTHHPRSRVLVMA